MFGKLLNGTSGSDVLLGSIKNDWFITDAGNDIAYGGLGNDWFFINGWGNKRIYSGAGNDTLYIQPGNFTYILDSDAWFDTGDGDDVIWLNIDRTLPDATNALAQHTIISGKGNDIVDAQGNALHKFTTYLGAGNDNATIRLFNQLDDVVIWGGRGSDSITSVVDFSDVAEGNDFQLIGGTGNDSAVLDITDANDVSIALGAGDDAVTIDGSNITDGTVYGGIGDDLFELIGPRSDYLIEVVEESTPGLRIVGTNNISLTTHSFEHYQFVSNAGTEVYSYDELVAEITNMAPTANDFLASGDEDNNIIGQLTGNDVDGDTITFELVDQSNANGQVTIQTNGQFTYTPNANYFGPASFTFRTFDGVLYSEVATATININPINDAPIVVPDFFTVDEDSTLLSLDVLANDVNVDAGDILSIENIQEVGTNFGGLLVISSQQVFYDVTAASFQYLKAGESQVINLSYDVVDLYGGRTASMATITVNGVNDAPTDITLDHFSVDEEEEGAVIGNVVVTDLDDANHTITSDDARFEVVNGQLKLKEGESLDFETEPSISINLTATDLDNLSFTKAFTISVNDVDENPVNFILLGDSDDNETGTEGIDIIEDSGGFNFIETLGGNDELTLYRGNGASEAINTVYAGEGDDTIMATDTRYDTLYGDSGNDQFILNNARDALVYGGNDNDTITVTDTRDAILFGDDGDDVFNLLGAEDVTISGGTGADQFIFDDQAGDIGSAVIDDFDLDDVLHLKNAHNGFNPDDTTVPVPPDAEYYYQVIDLGLFSGSEPNTKAIEVVYGDGSILLDNIDNNLDVIVLHNADTFEAFIITG